jgi:hypothetical protein
LVFVVVSFLLAFSPIIYTRSSSPFVLHGPHLILRDLIIIIILGEIFTINLQISIFFRALKSHILLRWQTEEGEMGRTFSRRGAGGRSLKS